MTDGKRESSSPVEDLLVPDVVAAAWGMRPPPAHGPRRSFTLDQVVGAAVRVAATEGLGAVSMARVAQELGTGAMSLYRYVATKDDLLLLMVDAAYGAPPAIAAGGWRDALAGWAVAGRDVLRRHPWMLRVPVPGPPVTPNQLAWMEAGLRCLDGTPLAEIERLMTIEIVSGFVRSQAMLSADVLAASTVPGSRAEQVLSRYGQVLAAVVDPARFPAVRALVATGMLDGALPGEQDDEDFDYSFDFGLGRILDGVAALIAERSEATA
ncbi:MAG: TetR/AcrR family transcriptional regulator C-terminal domain-containing protein [Kineosporiaceae bacterium]